MVTENAGNSMRNPFPNRLSISVLTERNRTKAGPKGKQINKLAGEERERLHPYQGICRPCTCRRCKAEKDTDTAAVSLTISV